MPTRHLPDQPSLDQLRNQARELQQAARAGRPDALAILAEHLHDASEDNTSGAGPAVPLHLAQLALARMYGYPSWSRLRAFVAAVQRFSRFPENEPEHEELHDRFLRHAVLVYGRNDGPARWQVARDLLAADPGLTRRSIFAAAAAADHEAVADLLAGDPGLARREGGPFRWEPLLYLTYSRLEPRMSAADVLTAAGLLLQHGADPNAGYLWHGLPTPFTALTGVFGEGEQGPLRQPAHPQQHALARLLLEAGADPNDGQTLYNRMFSPGNDHLELLFDYGLGTGAGGPWHARLPDDTESPHELLRAQLNWAITHGMTQRIELLALHGVDLSAPLDSGRLSVTPRTPLQLAQVAGRRDSLAALAALGAEPEVQDPETTMVAALLNAEADAVVAMELERPGLLEKIRAEYPSLILRAAVLDRPDAIGVLVRNDFDVNAMGRQDTVIEQQWETALHHAAGEGKLEMARLLLELGADPTIRDTRFHATPLDWAQHLDRSDVADLLGRSSSAQPGPRGA